MTKEEYGDLVLRYKGCGACFPMYHTLSRFEKIWFTAIQKDIVKLEKSCDETQELLDKQIEATYKLDKENAELKEKYVKNICDCDICDTYCNSQLIKAKEIIKTFLGFAEEFGYSPSMDKFIAEAEQFIKE